MVGLGYAIAKTVAQADAVVVSPPILRAGNRGLNGERGNDSGHRGTRRGGGSHPVMPPFPFEQLYCGQRYGDGHFMIGTVLMLFFGLPSITRSL